MHLFYFLLPLLSLVGIWAIISLGLSFVGGWRQLALSYSGVGPFTGKKWWFQSGQTRWGLNYGHCLKVMANTKGIRISVIFPPLLCHPPLFFPWSDISVDNGGFWMVRLRLKKEPDIPFYLTKRLTRKIVKAVEDNWPEET